MKYQIAVVFLLALGCVSANPMWPKVKLMNSWSPNIKDIAKGVNCGDAKHNFTLMWTPSKIQFGKDILFYFDMVAAEDFSHGNVEFVLKIEKTPIIKKTEPIDCHNSRLKGILKHLPLFKFPCPFRKGEHFKLKGMKVPFKTPIPLPAGHYEVDVKVTQPDGRLFLCTQMNLNVLEAKFDYDDY